MSRQSIKDFLTHKLTNPWISYVASRILGYGIPIFMLHRTSPDNTPNQKQTPSYLRRCLTYLKENGYHFVSVAEIIQSIINKTSLPNKAIAFTIDDGFADQASLAAPVFIEFQCPVTIFLITDFIDGKLWPWFSKVQYLIKSSEARSIDFNIKQKRASYFLTDNNQKRVAYHGILELIKLMDWSDLDNVLTHVSDITNVTIPKEPPEDYTPMTWLQAQELEKKGISFGPHTLTHPILSNTGAQESMTEINQSWERLKQKLQNPSPVFCYPNGTQMDYGRREIDILKKSEMIGAVSTIPKQYRVDSNTLDVEYNLPRYSLPDDFNTFIMYCSWVEFAKEKILRSN